MNSITYPGLDISKLTLELSPHPGLRRRAFPNDPSGHRALLTVRRRRGGPVQILCEATGGYEHPLLQTLHRAAVPVTLLNPRRVRDYARASGLLAKTDRLDAAVLADYGRAFMPAPTPPPGPVQQRLQSLVTRRQELLQLLGQEQLRAEPHHDPFVIRQARRLVRTLQQHRVPREAEWAALQHAAPPLDAQVQRLRAIQGVGQRTARLRPWPGWPPTTTTVVRSVASDTSRTDAHWRGRPSTGRRWWRPNTTPC